MFPRGKKPSARMAIGGGGPKDGRSQSEAGAKISKPNLPCGFPFTIGSWCKKLKDGSYPRLPYHQGKLVYQRSQTPGFPLAPLHKGRRQILCSTSELLLTSRSALNGIPNLVSKCPWWKSVGTKPIAGSGVKSGTYFPRFTRQQQGGVLVLSQPGYRSASVAAEDLPRPLEVTAEMGQRQSYHLQGRRSYSA